MTRLLTPNPDTSAPVQAPTPGEVLGGKYRVEREIGSGGMGIVYEVTHLVMTKKRFAVKWLLPLPDGYQGEDAQAAARRFVREAEIAGGICHPNVVEVYDVTVSDSGCFMVMELLEGESLEARLKREGKLSVAEACRITVACASGVGAAHAANVIHRDLKPANIFLMQLPEAGPSRPKVLDFGISRFTAPNGSVQSTVTRAGTLIGTPMYMAPEQLRGFECDARTDVYGLGVTLYEALSGKPAYQAPTHADLVVRILTGDAHEMRELEPSVPAGLAAVVMQALHHKPEQRFASVQAFAEALQPYVSYSAAQATSGGRRGEGRPRKAAWALGLVIAAGALGVESGRGSARPARRGVG
jgi:serine/threonine protein kinase